MFIRNPIVMLLNGYNYFPSTLNNFLFHFTDKYVGNFAVSAR